MKDPTINFPPSFFTNDRLSEMWSYARYFIAYNSKLVMIFVAIITAGMIAVLIVQIPGMVKDQDQGKKDEDEDFEYY